MAFELYNGYQKRWAKRLAREPSIWKREWVQYKNILKNGSVEDFFFLMLELPDVFMSFFQPDKTGQMELCPDLEIANIHKQELAQVLLQSGYDFADYSTLLNSTLFDRFLLDGYGSDLEARSVEKQVLTDMLLRMVPIKAGRFYMGTSPSADLSCTRRPGFLVHLTRDFMLSQYLVTQLLWKQ